MIENERGDQVSLTIVGTGIKFLSHLSMEAQAYIKNSDKVLFLVNDPAFKSWIEQNNSNAESLDSIYFGYEQRQTAYRAISDYILQELSKSQHLCVVLYGHPTVHAQPALEAARVAKQLGVSTQVLPAISAEACLFADLLIDPGEYGCQSYDASDFVLRHRPFHANSHLILWQVAMVGAKGWINARENLSGIKALKEYLLKIYATDHEVVLYEAAQYPGFDPKIISETLQNLSKLPFTPLSTLYVPPLIPLRDAC